MRNSYTYQVYAVNKSLFRLLLLNAYKSYPSSKCTRECTTMRFKATPTAFFIGLKMNHRAITEQNNSCLSQVENLCCCPIQQKQKSRGVITASLDFFVRIAQAVHNLLMLCDSPRIYSTYWGLVILQTKHLRHFHFYQELFIIYFAVFLKIKAPRAKRPKTPLFLTKTPRKNRL